MSAGPIPWRDIINFAHYMELDEDFIDPFLRIIRAMDDAYLEWVKKKADNG